MIEWKNRPLGALYPMVYLDCIVAKVRHEGSVVNRSISLALGINLDSHKELLGIWLANNQGALCWLKEVYQAPTEQAALQALEDFAQH